jgi:hypothetical protein
MKWLDRIIERLKRSIAKRLPWGDKDEPGEPDGSTVWRDGRDVDVIQAVNNAVEFRTRNVLPAPGGNRDGGMEWIIARVNGSGYSRLLIMVMAGNRPPTRIYFQTGGTWTETNSRFSVPLPGPSLWRVEARSGAIRVLLDGREIWAAAGSYSVDRVTMCDSVARGFLGQWARV